MTWNFNLDEAPEYTAKEVVYKAKGKTATRIVKERIHLNAASKCGMVVPSYLTETGRWSGFTDESPPIAFQLLPTHPNKEA